MYVVNVVDEVTQYEHVGVVPAISERYMTLLLLFPFDLLGLYADNGSRRDAPAPSTSTTSLRC